VEEGQNLRLTSNEQTLKNATAGWWESRKTHQTYNRHFNTGRPDQVGGTSVTIVNTLSHRAKQVADDPSGLGRWTSIMIEGKHGMKTRIVSAYRPCKSRSGLETAYTQHLIYWDSMDRYEDPRNIFMQDLKQAILEWKEQGEQIILCGDFNTGDKNNVHTASEFWNPWLEELDLIDVHKTSTGMDWLPATHERGSSQIDYIFISPSIRIKRAGFLPFSKFPGDHRAIWVDIQTEDIIGYNAPKLSIASARRLKSDHPKIRNKYLHFLKDSLIKEGLLDAITWLNQITPSDWTSSHTSMYDDVSSRIKLHMTNAERECRKLKTGDHPFSAELNRARKKKFLWELVVKDILGLHVPKRKILKLKKYLKIKHPKPSLKIAERARDKARKQYKEVKRRSKQLRVAFRDQLAMERATENNTKIASEIQNIMHWEEIKAMHQKIKYMQGRGRGESTTAVIITKKSGQKK